MDDTSYLVEKYNVAGPRYTSYPTVPFWANAKFNTNAWKTSLRQTFAHTNKPNQGLSLYIHLPYCESMCTFCGCFKHITKNHTVEQVYIASLLKEWQLYLELFAEKPIIKEIHLGGGTPTFFGIEQLKYLVNTILSSATVAENFDFGFEGHPNNTSYEHLAGLFALGFKRVSFGVQDYSPVVQKAINRVQAYQKVKQVTDWARLIGYTSISHDLVYGLPFQTLTAVEKTVEKTVALKPDRISAYSYAHVPWVKHTGQRGFNEADLPSAHQKTEMAKTIKKLFIQHGYEEIGMDHFALPQDGLTQALKAGKLHRNFMGYTHSDTLLTVGLGASAIGDSWGAFAQNVKDIKQYHNMLHNNILPIAKGHLLTPEDLSIRKIILDIICKFQVNLNQHDFTLEQWISINNQLLTLEKDGLIHFDAHSLTVTTLGKSFVRNICMVFDQKLSTHTSTNQIFSKTI